MRGIDFCTVNYLFSVPNKQRIVPAYGDIIVSSPLANHDTINI